MVTRCLAEPDARPGIAGLLSWPLPRGTNAQNLTGQERLAGNVHISAAPVLSIDPSGKDYRAPDMKSHHPVTHSTASDVCCRSPATCLSDTAPRELLPSGHFPREEPWAQGSDSWHPRSRPAEVQSHPGPQGHTAEPSSESCSAWNSDPSVPQTGWREEKGLGNGTSRVPSGAPPPEENYRVLTAVRSPKFTKPQRINPLRPK